MSSHVLDEEEDEATWEESEEDAPVTQPVVAITSAATFPTAREALAYDAGRGLDVVALIGRLKLDFYGGVRLINTARRMAAERAPADVAAALEADVGWLEDPAALQPVVTDDGLILALDDLVGDDGPTDEHDALRAALDDLSRKLARSTAAVRHALDSGDPKGLADTAALLPQLESTQPPAEADDDSRAVAGLKRDIADATNNLLLVARRAQALLPSSS